MFTQQNPLPIDTSQFLLRFRDVPLRTFTAVAIATSDLNPADGRRLLHWRASGTYLSSYNRTPVNGSTTFDTRTIAGQTEVQLISKNFDISRNSLFIFQTPFRRHCTSNDIYGIIQAHRLNQYDYNGGGSGCLTWTMKLIEVLTLYGLIDPTSYIGFNMKVAEARNSSDYWVPDETGARFY
ncbi:hypothetical protein F5877DRAFT_72952 [Lentinula edodes]|nr:hypothetical protein F5877DRAFT_72952 [Lentinula edodes]